MPQALSPNQNKLSLSVASASEFVIYTYDHHNDKNRHCDRWQRVATIKDQAQALTEAQHLFESRLYRKVEIKQKLFHPKKGCHIAKTLRVYEDGQKNRAIAVASALVVVSILVSALCLTYL